MKVKDCTSIYPFNAIDYVQKGKLVFGVDRYECECFEVNTLTVNKLASIIEEAKINKTRFEFWVVEVSEDE